MRWNSLNWIVTMIGFDTGFFIRLLAGERNITDIWKEMIESEESSVCSCLTIFELERLSLRGVIDHDASSILLEAISVICKIGWLENKDSLLHASRISHGTGIPAIDALILSNLIENGAKTIYSTDKHFDRYKKKGIVIHLV